MEITVLLGCQHNSDSVMYIIIFFFFVCLFVCKARYCSNFINFYVTEANSHSPLPGQQIPLRSIRFRCIEPGRDVIVRCTTKNVYLASCPYITEKLTMIQLSFEARTFTGCYVSPTLHIESSTLLK